MTSCARSSRRQRRRAEGARPHAEHQEGRGHGHEAHGHYGASSLRTGRKGSAGGTERWREQAALARRLATDPNLAFIPADVKAAWTREPSRARAGYANIAFFLKQYSEAGVIGQQKGLGSVEPGKLADFTVIEGNPLNDIGATKNVRLVIQNGQVLDTTYDPKWVNPIPRRAGPPVQH